jgi:hypothetical protein
MKKEKSLEDALVSMHKLIDMQQDSLRTAHEIIKLKDARLDIADQLIILHKKEIKVLRICFYSLVALNIITTIIRLL